MTQEQLNTRLKLYNDHYGNLTNHLNMSHIIDVYNFNKPYVFWLNGHLFVITHILKSNLIPIAQHLKILFNITPDETLTQEVYDARKDKLYKLDYIFENLPKFAEYGTPERDSLIEVYATCFPIIADYIEFIIQTKKQIKQEYIIAHHERIGLLPPLQDFVSRGNMMFVFLNVHGGLTYTDKKLTSMVIPENLEIYRIMQSTFGTVNICARDIAESYFNTILNKSHYLLTDKRKKNTLKNNRKIAKYIIQTSLPKAKCILDDIRTKTTPNTRTRSNFISHCLRPHTKHFTTGMTMIDKVLCINFGEIGLSEINIITNKQFKQAVNIVDYIPITINPEYNTIDMRLGDIIALLSPFINILVLFDLSCSTSNNPFNVTTGNANAAEPNPSFRTPDFNSSPYMNTYIEKIAVLKKYSGEYVTLKNEILELAKNRNVNVNEITKEFMVGLQKRLALLPDFLDEMPDYSDYMEEYKQKLEEFIV